MGGDYTGMVAWVCTDHTGDGCCVEMWWWVMWVYWLLLVVGGVVRGVVGVVVVCGAKCG